MIEFIALILLVGIVIATYLLRKKRLIEKGVARIYEYGGLFYWNFRGKGYNLTSGWFRSIGDARRNLYEELREKGVI